MNEIRFQDKEFSNAQLREIALLHRAGIPNGFLSSFSIAFLQRLYKAISMDPYSFLTIATDVENRICLGFIAGTIDITSMYYRVIIRQGFLLALLLVPDIFKVSFVIKCIETLIYPFFINMKWSRKRSDGRQPAMAKQAELLAMVVKQDARRCGVGKALVKALELYFKRQNISSYKVVTSSKDEVSNIFYSTLGFQKVGLLAFHGNSLNSYIKEP